MRLTSYPLLVAPQTPSSNVVRFIHAIFRRATNTLEGCGSPRTRHFSSRHKHPRGTQFASYTPLFVAPQTSSWNVVRLIHTYIPLLVAQQIRSWKSLYISIRVRPILMINVLRLKQSQSNEYVSNKAVLSNN